MEDADRAAREAANALQQGDAEKGSQKQREAQQKLDAAKQAMGQQPEEAGELDSSDEGSAGGTADIPKADAHKGPEEFRKRVLQGLGGSSDPLLREAVKRYAEGLLK
jgi:hypothetical protein